MPTSRVGSLGCSVSLWGLSLVDSFHGISPELARMVSSDFVVGSWTGVRRGLHQRSTCWVLYLRCFSTLRTFRISCTCTGNNQIGKPSYRCFEFRKWNSRFKSTSARDRSVDRFGRRRTSLKSSFGSKSMRGIVYFDVKIMIFFAKMSLWLYINF